MEEDILSDGKGLEASRHDFLKLMLGGGIAVAAAGALSGEAQAAEEKKYLVVITHGEDDPNRAVLPWLLLDGLTAKKTYADDGMEVSVWLVLTGLHGADTKRNGKIYSEIYKNTVAELQKRVAARGAKMGACPACGNFFKVEEANLAPGITFQGGGWMWKESVGKQVAVF
ncbi:MAG: hypothetical protein HYU64_08895 [Armatimonadetes bacterium]|nr:hypothetical protein [Armatimonadota bacterium]